MKGLASGILRRAQGAVEIFSGGPSRPAVARPGWLAAGIVLSTIALTSIGSPAPAFDTMSPETFAATPVAAAVTATSTTTQDNRPGLAKELSRDPAYAGVTVINDDYDAPRLLNAPACGDKFAKETKALQENIAEDSKARWQATRKILENSPTAMTLIHSLEKHGTQVVFSKGLMALGLRGGFVPEHNVILVDSSVPPASAAHIVAHEGFHAKGFHEGTGALLRMIDRARYNKESFVQGMIAEENVAWTLEAHVAHELQATHPEVLAAYRSDNTLKAVDDVYVRATAGKSPGQGIADAVTAMTENATLSRVSKAYHDIYGSSWTVSAICAENQDIAVFAERDRSPSEPRGTASRTTMIADMQKGALEVSARQASSDRGFAGLGSASAVTVPRHKASEGDISRRAVVSADGATVIVRKLDERTGKYTKMDNLLGPASIGPHGEAYAIDGKPMSKAQWIRDNRVVEAHLKAGLPPPAPMANATAASAALKL